MDESIEIYFLYALPVLVLLINRIPYVGKYIRVVNTLIHESGHTLFALLFNGEVLSVELFSDTSGTAVTKSKGKFSQFIVALSGYPFASLVAYLMFLLIFNGKDLIVLYVLASFALINLLMFVKNSYGIYWLISFAALLLLVNFYGNDQIYFFVASFLAGIVLFESVYSSFQLLVISYKNPKKAGDATNLAKITHIPSIIWSLIFLAQSLWFVYLTVLLFISITN